MIVLGTGTEKLKNLLYEEWLEKYADDEFNTDTSIYEVYQHIL